MTATLDELTDPLTVEDVEAATYAAFAARGLSTTTWKPGAVVRTIVFAFAIIVAAISQLQQQLARMSFLSLSAGDWLALVARYVYGVEKDLGSFATGLVTLTNASGFVYVLGAGDLTVTDSTTGKSYKNTGGFTLGAVSTLDVPVQALELGTASNAGVGDIDTMTTTLLGVTCANAAALVGSDPENDASLQLRCSEKTGALSPMGPADAYRYFASSTLRADGSSIGVTRVRVVADGQGNVTVYVATPSGEVSNPDDVALIQANIDRNAEPEAVTATVVSATPLPIDMTYTAWVDTAAGLTEAQVEELIEAAATAFLATEPIGGEVLPGEGGQGRVYLSIFEVTTGKAVTGLLRLTLTVPAADVDVDVTEAPVIGAISPTVNLVAGGA